MFSRGLLACVHIRMRRITARGVYLLWGRLGVVQMVCLSVWTLCVFPASIMT